MAMDRIKGVIERGRTMRCRRPRSVVHRVRACDGCDFIRKAGQLFSNSHHHRTIRAIDADSDATHPTITLFVAVAGPCPSPSFDTRIFAALRRRRHLATGDQAHAIRLSSE